MEIFDIAARISVMDGATKILGAIGANVLGLGKHFEDLERKAHGTSLRIKAAMAGIGTAMAGVGLFEGLNKFEEAGEDLVHVKTLFAAALPAAERVADMAKITAAAFKESSENMRSTLVGNVSAMHDLYVVTQSIDRATQLLPAYNRLANSFASVKDQEGLGDRASGANIASAIRAFELTGRNTEDRIAKAADGFVRATIALGEKAISGGQLMTQISNAGDARYGWSDDFLTKVLPAMIATGLQNRTGSALNAGSNNLYGGVASSQFQGTFQEKWGIHKKEDELLDEKGKFKGFKVGSMFEADKMRSNPLEWANDYREMLRDKFHVDVENAKQMQDVIGEIGRGNKLLKAELDELLLPQTNAQLNKEVGNVGKVGADALPMIDANDPKAVRQALLAKWKDAMDSLGEQLVQPMVDNVIKPLTNVLKDVTKFAGDHPAQLREIGVDLLKLSAGLTAVGAALAVGALMAAIGPAGWLSVGIGALATAISIWKPDAFKNFADGWKTLGDGLLHFNFDEVTSGFVKILAADFKLLPQGAQDGIKAAVDGIEKFFSTTIETLPGRLGSAIETMGSSLVAAIGAELKSLAGRLGGFLGRIFHTAYEGDAGSGGRVIKTSYEDGGSEGRAGGGTGPSADSIISRAMDGGGSGFNTRGVRNQNIGNIGWGAWAKAHGAIGGAGSDTGHLVAVFPSFEAGAAAAAALASAKYNSGARSIDQLIAGAHGWTPGNHAAAENIARMMGISPFGNAMLGDPTMMAKFKDALSVQELGPAGAKYAREHMHSPQQMQKAVARPPQITNHTIHTTVQLGVKAIAHAVTRQQTKWAAMPNAIGGMDDYGSWMSPGTTAMPA